MQRTRHAPGKCLATSLSHNPWETRLLLTREFS